MSCSWAIEIKLYFVQNKFIYIKFDKILGLGRLFVHPVVREMFVRKL